MGLEKILNKSKEILIGSLIVTQFFNYSCDSNTPFESSENLSKLRNNPCDYYDWCDTRYFQEETNNGGNDWVTVFINHVIPEAIYPEAPQNRDDEIGLFSDSHCVGAIQLCPLGSPRELVGWRGELSWHEKPMSFKYFDKSQNQVYSLSAEYIEYPGFDTSGLFSNSSIYAVNLYIERE